MSIQRKDQLAALEAALAANPGRTAYQAGLHVPVPQPGPEELLTGLQCAAAQLTLTLSLLRELERTGKARQEPDPKGARWYPVSPQDGA